MRIARFVAGFALVATVFGACTIEPNQLQAREEEYLARVRTALLPLRDHTAQFETVFQKTRGRTRFVSGLKGIHLSAGIRQSGSRLQRITPPPRFFGDVRKLLRAMARTVPMSEVAAAEADREELVASAAQHAEVVVTYESALASTSPRFCQIAATTRREADLCAPLGILPGATYGEQLRLILARLSAEFTPRGFVFVARAFNNDEVADYLRHVQPSIVNAISQSRDDLRRLIPTDEFSSDHRLLLDYFDQFLNLSQEISNAATSNSERLHNLFPRSQTLVNRTRDRLSKGIKAAVAVWFYPSS